MKKEFNITSYFNFRALFMGIGLSDILIKSKSYFFISIILGTFIGILLLLLFNKKNTNILNSIFNYFIYIVSLVILVNMISTMYLTEMSRLLIALPFLLILIYLISKNKIVINRLGNILLIINLSLYLIAFLSLLKYINLSSFNFTKINMSTILLSSLKYALYSTTPLIINKDEDISNKHIINTYLLSSLTMGIIFFLTYSILGSKLIEIYRYPEYIILKKVSITNAIQNIENIVSFMWIIDVFMVCSLSLNKIKSNIKNKTITYILIIISLPILLVVSKYYQLIISLYNYLFFFLLFIIITSLIIYIYPTYD